MSPATKKTFAAVAAISVALIVGGCSNAPSTPESFDAEVIFSGNADKIRVPTSTCDFYDGSVKPGTNAILRGPDDRILGKTELVEKYITKNTSAGVCASKPKSSQRVNYGKGQRSMCAARLAFCLEIRLR